MTAVFDRIEWMRNGIMSANTEKQSKKVGKRHFLTDELHALMNALQHLYLSISSKLVTRRIEPRAPSAMAGDSADIAASLDAHLGQQAEASQRALAERAAQVNGQAEQAIASEGEQHVKRHRPEGKRSGLGLFGVLSKHFRRGAAKGDALASLGEKMKANTTDHINKALRLARQGNAQGAKMHAELAENAMKTASAYMPEDEYKAFKEMVENRLKSIIG